MGVTLFYYLPIFLLRFFNPNSFPYKRVENLWISAAICIIAFISSSVAPIFFTNSIYAAIQYSQCIAADAEIAANLASFGAIGLFSEKSKLRVS